MNWNTLNKLFLGTLALSLSLGQLSRFELPIGGAIYVHDVILIGWVGMLLLKTRIDVNALQNEVSKKKYWLETLLIGWILWGWAGAVVVGTFDVATLLYAGRFGLYTLWAYLVNRSSNLKPSYFLMAFISSGVLMLLFGFLQYWVLPDTRWLNILGWDDHYYRLIGTLFDPNFMGMIFVLTFNYLEKLKPKVKNSHQKVVLLLQVLLTIGLALTFSRSSYLAFGIILAGLNALAFKEKIRFTFILGTIFLATLILAPKPSGEGVNLLRTASTAARVESSQRTVEYNWRTVLIGEGLFQPQRSAVSTVTFDRPNTARFADNIFIFFYNGTGLIGAGLILLLMGKWGKVLWHQDRLMFMALTATMTHSLFNNTLLQPFVLLFILGGIISSSKA